MEKIFVFSSDAIFTESIQQLSHFHPYNVQIASSRKDAVRFICNHPIQVCVIDLDKDGEAFHHAFRLIDEQTPIILTSSQNSEKFRLAAFENGCDDFVDKDMSVKELHYRLQAVIKRSGFIKVDSLADKPIVVGSSVIDFPNRTFSNNGQLTKLSKKEASLLRLFFENKGKLLSREQILKEVWHSFDYYTSKSMDVYMTKIRKILRQEQSVQLQNVHGTGYLLIEQQQD